MYYHSVLQVHKTLLTKSPRYLYDKLTGDGPMIVIPDKHETAESDLGHHSKPNFPCVETVFGGGGQHGMRHYRRILEGSRK